MDAALRQVSDQLDDATQRLLGSARLLSDSEVREPSLLPGWSRAHVLAHLARNADALRNVLVGARSGQLLPAYASAQARADDIEHGSRHNARELAEDVAAAAMALRTVARQLPAEAWRFDVRILDSPGFPAAEVLTRRLVEVELHHGDLGTGYGPAGWPAAFAAMDLAEPMRSWRQDRLSWAAQATGNGQPSQA
ncbi:MAG TPA: maleylpyruvate isomerase family mycothiol-dependent enzyme [Streptosporangiaceae bacterium]|nr:maleylpyruvate isomerase family mycothiol-dependent enzyme [Streptosporangiaceae bacterium]